MDLGTVGPQDFPKFHSVGGGENGLLDGEGKAWWDRWTSSHMNQISHQNMLNIRDLQDISALLVNAYQL